MFNTYQAKFDTRFKTPDARVVKNWFSASYKRIDAKIILSGYLIVKDVVGLQPTSIVELSCKPS